MSDITHNTLLHHDGGAHQLEVEIDGDQAVIRFGASFTLRMNETQVDNLREILHDTARELCIRRRDVAGAAEDNFIDEGIKAREALKAKRRNTLSDQQKVDVWDPQDPVNW